jgi:hypothetical protein
LKKGLCAATGSETVESASQESRGTATPSLSGAISGGSLPVARSRARASPAGARARVALITLALAPVPGTYAQPRVLERGYDAGVSGATLSETTLNTSNVAPGSLGLVFKLPVNDNIMAQPLYVPNVVIIRWRTTSCTSRP